MNPHDILPIIVVFLIFGGGTVKRFLSLMERRMELRMKLQDTQLTQQIAALRQELAGLRDTSTQYDMSVEHRLAEMERRLHSMETGHRPAAANQAEEPAQTQTVGLPHG